MKTWISILPKHDPNLSTFLGMAAANKQDLTFNFVALWTTIRTNLPIHGL